MASSIVKYSFTPRKFALKRECQKYTAENNYDTDEAWRREWDRTNADTLNSLLNIVFNRTILWFRSFQEVMVSTKPYPNKSQQM